MRTGRILILALALALTVGTTAQGSSRTFFHTPMGQRTVYKPSRIVFSDATLTHIHWRGWNHRIAHGTGRARINLCNPFCAAGPIVHTTVSLKMYRRHLIGNRHFYRCVKGVAHVLNQPDQKIHWCNIE